MNNLLTHYPVNWIDGMKLNSSHFIAVQDFVTDSVALLTRPPLVSISTSTYLLPFDLHVLSLPPAFNLSHDQTLQFKKFNRSILLT